MKLEITVDGRTYAVEVEVEPEPRHPRPIHAQAPTPVPATTPVPGSLRRVTESTKVCRSPIAGTVVRVPIQPGQAIQPGDVLIVLEAMKMETNLTASMAAEVSHVLVKVGDTVQTDQVLVEFA